MIETCPCGKQFTTFASRKKRGGGKYCSRRCYELNYTRSSGLEYKENLTYGGVHHWISVRLPKPDCCEWCGKKAKLDYANLSGEYRKDVSDWATICRPCHFRYDKVNVPVTAGV